MVQYIDLIKSDETKEGNSNGDSYVTSNGARYPFISAGDYGEDSAAGHGTHTAGSAAGATISNPAELANCTSDRVLSCVGGCIDETSFFGDDLISSYYQQNELADLDRLCPAYDCDGLSDDVCLSDDAATTLTEHGGVARGAKVSIFDVITDSSGLGIYLAGNGLWKPTLEIGGRLHSNSWGSDSLCMVDSLDGLYDEFMWEVRDDLTAVGRLVCQREWEWEDMQFCRGSSVDPAVAFSRAETLLHEHVTFTVDAFVRLLLTDFLYFHNHGPWARVSYFSLLPFPLDCAEPRTSTDFCCWQ